MSEYLRLMKLHSDNLGLVRSPVPTRALVSQVLLKLDEEYNPVVATLQGKEDVSGWKCNQSFCSMKSG